LIDINNDSSGLIQVMQMLADRGKNIDDSRLLTDVELNNLYVNSKLIQKIVDKYPEEFVSVGYQRLDQDGVIIDENDAEIISAMKNALIASRLYGRCFLILDFGDLPETIVKKGSKLIGHSIEYDLYRQGDFFYITSEKYHYTRVIEFIGKRTFKKYVRKNDLDYCQSVIQGLYNSFKIYINNNDNANLMLANLSYLTVGIENLGNMQISNEGKKVVHDRLSSLNMNRDISRILAYDKSKEVIGFISQSISGVNELIDQSKSLFASETGYPVNEIFETSVSQTLGTGLQNQLVARYLWARRVRNWCLNDVLPYLKKYFSIIHDDKYRVDIPFIVDLTEEEKVEIEKTGAERSKILIDAGVVTPLEVRSSYKSDHFTSNISLNKAPVSISNDSSNIPDNIFWDNLSRVTIEDFDNLATKISE
jgi:hypothetical protein